MNSRQKKTLAAVFSEPAKAKIAWADIECLLVAAGANVVEGSGSRVRFHKDGVSANFHRPHPAKEAKKYQVRLAREYLAKIGVTP